METLQRYHDELIYWNQRVNMISRKDEQNVWDRHILHSLLVLNHIDIKRKSRILDVGTGGGLPGIPLKIARPDVKITLVDSIKKKTTMAEMFASHTGLKDIRVITGRTEELARDRSLVNSFDVVVSRAVARTGVVLSWITDLVKPNSVCAFLKGGDLAEEIHEATSHHPAWTIIECPIRVFGQPWFEENEKKVVLCTRS